ncbi:hypothetical protein ACLE20_13515, partial [Rhizobium sp. YIM 134829]|uniref:hypothetical protein n=1 Tax=Rhizobium sp. YIM 134829 TaxID=3390453 RepID=UPI00397ACBD1
MVRLRVLLLAGVVLTASAGAAAADPGSLIAGAILGAGAAGTIGATLLAGVINAAIGIGLQLLTARRPDVPKPEDVQNVIRQSLPVRSRHYGLRRLGGPLLFIENKDGAVFQIVAFGSQRFDAVVDWILDGRHITLNADGVLTSDPYYEENTRILYKPGTASQTAFTRLVEQFPTIWTADHRNRGIANALLETRGVKLEKFGKVYPNKIAKLNGIFQTALVLDPRTGSTAYSANLALQLRDYLTSDDGLQIAPSFIDVDDIKQAADDCDVLLPTKSGGTVRRYHGALSYSFDEEPASVMSRFLTAMDGRIALKPNGKIGVSAGVWREPTVTLRDEHIIDFSMSDGAGPLREFNEIRVKYEEPLADFAAADAQPWRQDDEIATYGEVRSKTIDAYEIQNHNHARRIAKIAAARGAPRWQGTLKTTLFGMNAWDQRFVRVQIADLDMDGDLFDETMEVADITLNIEEMTVSIKVSSFGADAYAFNPSTEEGTAPRLPERIEEDAIPDVQMASAIGTQRTLAGGVKVALIKVSVAAPAGQDDLKLDVEYSRADLEEWQAAAVAPDALKVDIVGLEDGALYDVRMRWRTASGAAGPYALIENIPAVADPNPPLPVTNLDTTPGPTAGTVTIAWTNPNSENFKAVRIYRNSTTNFATATDLEG